MMQEKNVMWCHVSYREHGDRGDGDSEVRIPNRPLVAVRMKLPDHQARLHSEVLQVRVHRVQALPALGIHPWHDDQSTLEQHSGVVGRAPRLTELADLRSELIGQFRLAGSVDVQPYLALQRVLSERTRN